VTFGIRSATIAGTTTGSVPVTQTIAVGSGLHSTEQPVAALYLANGVITINTPEVTSRQAIGGTDGTTQRAICEMTEDGAAAINTDSGGQADNATAIQFTGRANQARQAEARWGAWVNGGSDILVDDLFTSGQAAILRGLYFFGCPAKLVEFAGHGTANSSNNVPDLGFEPDLALVFGFDDAFPADTGHVDMRYSIGCAVKTPSGGVQQWAFRKYTKDVGGVTTLNAGALRDDCLFTTFTDAADSARLELTSWNGSTPTITTRDASVSKSCAILFLKTGRRLYAGVLPTSDPGGGAPFLDTSAGGSPTITVGFLPQAYCLLGTMLATKNSRTTSNLSDGWSVGWHTGSEQFALGGHEPDGTGAPETASIHDDAVVAHVVQSIFAGSATNDWTAAHTAMQPTGPQITFGTASATPRLTAILAIGTPEAPGWLPEIVRRRHRTMVWGPLGK
jgi:hypothetical protein